MATAKKLARKLDRGAERIQPALIVLGELRRAIEDNWPAPEELRHAEVSAGREFAQHFYAGLAGNTGLPVAEPSARDIELGGQFVERLFATKQQVQPVWS